MEDLKKDLKIDKEKVSKSLENENKLRKLEKLRNENKLIINNFKTWEELFTYDENRTSLENFLLCRTAGAFGLYKEGFDDPDSTPKALKYLEDKLKNIDEVDTVEVGKAIHKKEKDRVFKITLKDSAKGHPYPYQNKNKEIYLESDTANSLMTDLGDFIRIILKGVKGKDWPELTYIKEYDLPKNKNNNFYKPFKYFYWYTLISKLPDMLKDKEGKVCKEKKACLEVLEKRAALIHTLGNVILVPYGYNSPRGYGLATYQSKIAIQDRLDLTIRDFNEMLADKEFGDEQFYERNKKFNKEKTSVDAVRFLMNHQAELFPDIPKYPDDNLDKIEWLTEVSNAIIETLNKA